MLVYNPLSSLSLRWWSLKILSSHCLVFFEWMNWRIQTNNEHTTRHLSLIEIIINKQMNKSIKFCHHGIIKLLWTIWHHCRQWSNSRTSIIICTVQIVHWYDDDDDDDDNDYNNNDDDYNHMLSFLPKSIFLIHIFVLCL